MSGTGSKTSGRFFATPKVYIAFEEEADEKHEWIDGKVVPLHRPLVIGGDIVDMAAGTPQHALMSTNVIATLQGLTRGGPCRVYSSDLGVRTPSFRRQSGYKGVHTHPDATVVCGKLETDKLGKKTETALNPTLLVEVLSESIESHDRGRKFER